MKFVLLSIAFLTMSAMGVSPDCVNCIPGMGSVRPVVPEWPIEYTTIEKINYERNSSASFCKRPVEMVDTIVLHHSETRETDTPERINEYHLSRSTQNDQWYMIAYSYVINAAYRGNTLPAQRVAEGRPLDIVGAHAGKGIMIPMDAVQKKLWSEGKVTCGKENSEFAVDPKLESKGKISANVTTIGLVVIGNYSVFSSKNPNGYPKNKKRYPTDDALELIARTSCQLQKKYPRMKNIKVHNNYHPTSCPGTIAEKEILGSIKNKTRKYGCKFY